MPRCEPPLITASSPVELLSSLIGSAPAVPPKAATARSVQAVRLMPTSNARAVRSIYSSAMRIGSAWTLALATLVAACGAKTRGGAGTGSAVAPKTLYDRIGGKDAITGLVEDFVAN